VESRGSGRRWIQKTLNCDARKVSGDVPLVERLDELDEPVEENVSLFET
jgi:hypothetical protein